MIKSKECVNCMRVEVCEIEELEQLLSDTYKIKGIMPDFRAMAEALYYYGVRCTKNDGIPDGYVVVFLNTCEGEFNLSADFLMEYGLTSTDGRKISRTDPRLWEYYRLNKGGLSGVNARIRPQFIRKGTKYIITDYAGKEFIKTEADMNFMIAGEEN